MPKVSARWRKLLALIPGYDCFATAAPGMYFDEAAADHVVNFFPTYLHHVKGALAGQSYELASWQQAWIGCAFGWKKANGKRRYNEVFVYVPKKNDKTTSLAGLVLYVMTNDGEMSAEVYSVASSRDQASIIFQTSAGMVKLEPDLAKVLTIYGFKGGSQQKSIQYLETMSSYRPLASDEDTADGLQPHFVVGDELHRHANGRMMDIMKRGTSARSNPMVVNITTADYDRESACNSKLAEAERVRDNGGDPGKPGYDPSFLPVIYCASPDDDWTDPKVWAKANPNLGRSKSVEYMQTACAKAQEDAETKNNFLRLELNVKTQQTESLIPMDHWRACPKTLDPTSLAGRTCFGGLDLAQRDDLAAFSLVFPPDDRDKGVWDILWWLFCPSETIRRRQLSSFPYRAWTDAGWITETMGNDIDFAAIRQTIIDATKKYNVVNVGYDPAMGTQLSSELLNNHGIQMTVVRQGMLTLGEPTKQLVSLVRTRRINHGGNPVAAWMAENCMGVRDNNANIRAVKDKSKDKIDGISATINALAIAATADSGPSVYGARGVLTI